jgi:PAS domain S-box-containing protein
MSANPSLESEFEQLFEVSPCAMLIVDGERQIEIANAEAEGLFGYGPSQLDGQPVETLFPDQVLDLFPDGSRPGQEASRSVLLVGSRRDSTQFPVEASIIPWQTKQGAPAFVIVKDFTETQRAQFLLHRGLDLLKEEAWDRQALIGRLIQAQEDERARIAADIHDDTIQVISAASLRLQQLRLRLQTPEEVAILDKFEQALGLSLSRLRQIVFDLRPSGVERGVVAAIRADLERMAADTGIRFWLDDRLAAPIPVSAAVPIYRVAGEALTNVRKHANARTVWVGLHEVDHGCLVSIVDDGAGYHPAEVEGRRGHLGLSLMRERVQLAGGWCRTESTPGVETTVEFWIPYDGVPERPDPAGELD